MSPRHSWQRTRRRARDMRRNSSRSGRSRGNSRRASTAPPLKEHDLPVVRLDAWHAWAGRAYEAKARAAPEGRPEAAGLIRVVMAASYAAAVRADRGDDHDPAVTAEAAARRQPSRLAT